MMSKYLLLLLIPIVYGRIAIKITAGRTEAETSVEYTGEDIAIISDTERKSFNIEERSLKEAVRKYHGREPTDVFVKGPTPWGDVYRQFHWEEVKRTLKPVRARIMGINTRPVIVASEDFENRSRVKGKYTASISHQVEKTATISWSTEKELSAGQSISYSVNSPTASFGGTTSMSFTGRWGNGTSKAKAITLGTASSLEVELNPGEAVVATLSATRGTLKIEVDYEAYLTGQVFANFDPKFEGHSFWAYPIQNLLMTGGIPNNVTSTEKISIGFFTSAKVVITDKDISSKIIKEVSAKIISSPETLPESGYHGGDMRS